MKEYKYTYEEYKAYKEKKRQARIEKWRIEHEQELERRRLAKKTKKDMKKEKWYDDKRKQEEKRIAKKQAKKLKITRERLRKKEQNRLKIERKKEREKAKKVREAEKRKVILLARKELDKEKRRLKRQKVKEKKLEKQRQAKERMKEKRRLYIQKHAREKFNKRQKRYHRKVRSKIKHRNWELNHYYDVVRVYRLSYRIANDDVPGKYVIAIAQDGVITSTRRRASWWTDALEKFNKMKDENHASSVCARDNFQSGCRTRDTEYEIVLMKHVNPEVEDNTSVFRDWSGKTVAVSTDEDEWRIVLKEPWYVEEKFKTLVGNRYETHDADWIGKNFIEPNLSEWNIKRVLLWRNTLIFDGDEGFEIVKAKNNQTAANLYMSLFKRYENTEYVFFIGTVSRNYVSVWRERIEERTRFVQKHSKAPAKK